MRSRDQKSPVLHHHFQLVGLSALHVVVDERLVCLFKESLKPVQTLFGAGAGGRKAGLELIPAGGESNVVSVRTGNDRPEKFLFVDQTDLGAKPGKELPYPSGFLWCADVAELVKGAFELESPADEAGRDASGKIVLLKKQCPVTLAGDLRGGGQPSVPRPDDDHVIIVAHLFPLNKAVS